MHYLETGIADLFCHPDGFSILVERDKTAFFTKPLQNQATMSSTAECPVQINTISTLPADIQRIDSFIQQYRIMNKSRHFHLPRHFQKEKSCKASGIPDAIACASFSASFAASHISK